MPYIKEENRKNFIHPAQDIVNSATCAGDLNYAISLILHGYLAKNGLKYSNLNELVGMMECCKLELYRMIAAPYEDQKIKENGAVGILPIETDSNHNATPKSY
jgi:hypothetical protein